MNYGPIEEAIFLERPNRFIAYCRIKEEIHSVHVKNTGRCQELLVEGTKVYLEKSTNPSRKTKYSLITVQKGDRLINIDSQAPNVVAYEALKNKTIILPHLDEEILHIQREKTYGHSRFDIYIETPTQKAFVEVKGVTLEEDNIVMFPDAKTLRGVKHVLELVKAHKEGYKCYVLFVIQMEGVRYFMPHKERHAEFAQVLLEGAQEGIEVLAYDTIVTTNTLHIHKNVEVILS